MKTNAFHLLIIAHLLLFASVNVCHGQEDRVYEYAEENQQCLKCHGAATYFYYNNWIERDVKERMNPYFIIDSAMYYQSNHWNFQCTDCHSYEYEEFPHSGELRMEPKFECMDCHEGDEAYAQYNFEHIYEEYHESVHASTHDEEFTCWMCHDPHSYKINARSNIPLKEVIVYDNSICLSCHADINKYQLISALANPNVLQTHEWLPNQSLHFRNVRCIECHSEIDESILVAHKILPKEEAVRLCVDCHSSNSILMATLYKYQAKERRNQIGFFNAAILSESFVIGANRNYFLSLSSVIIFSIIIAGIAIHITFRIITRKTN